MIDLGSLGGSRAEARGVNSAKQVVGFSENADGARRAFYAYDGVMQDLNDLVDRSASRGRPGSSDLQPVLFEANAINNNGHIIANGTYPLGEEVHSFLLVPNRFDLDSPGFTTVDMGFLPSAETGGPGGPRTSYGLDLNDFDEVVGSGDGQAFLWMDDDMYQLEFVASESQANAINYFGIIVGSSAGRDGRHTASLWSLWLQGRRWDLRTPAGWSSEANDLNDSAEIVGSAAHDSEMPSAMLWSGNHVYNLNNITAIPLGPGSAFWDRLEEATGIDEHHRIVGFGRMTDGTTRAFLLTPMPVE